MGSILFEILKLKNCSCQSVGVVLRFSSRTSSVYNHLLASPDRCDSYSDSCFTVLCRGCQCCGLQLKVLKAIYQPLYKPNNYMCTER